MNSSDTLLAFAIIVAAGLVVGDLSTRLRLPRVTGWIAAGVLLQLVQVPGLSPYGPHAQFAPFVDFVLGYIAFVVGSALNVERLRNAHMRLVMLALTEALVTPTVVALSLLFIGGQSTTLAWVMGAIAIAGAPGTTLIVLREARAKGVFTKTLMASLPLIDLVALCVFALVTQFATLGPLDATAVAGALGLAGRGLAIAAGVGLGSGALLLALTSRLLTRTAGGPAYAVTILVAWGVASNLGTSGILACTIAGLTVANFRHDTARAGEAYLAPFAGALFTAFYTLAGLRLDFRHLAGVLPLVGLFFVARALSKSLSGYLAMSFAGTIPAARRYLGLALLPHGGVAIGLILVVQESPAFASIADAVTTIGLSALALNQLAGPSMTRLALSRVGEIGLDRSRLLDFLTEQNILTGLKQESRREVLERLTRRLLGASASEADGDALVERLLEAECRQATCVGEGLMIPHVSGPEGGQIRGVLGLSSEGLDFDAPDGKPIHAVLVLIIPADQRTHHLQILAALASLIASRPETREHLYHARSPAHAHKLLNPRDDVGFNYFRDPPPA